MLSLFDFYIPWFESKTVKETGKKNKIEETHNFGNIFIF